MHPFLIFCPSFIVVVHIVRTVRAVLYYHHNSTNVVATVTAATAIVTLVVFITFGIPFRFLRSLHRVLLLSRWWDDFLFFVCWCVRARVCVCVWVSVWSKTVLLCIACFQRLKSVNYVR